MKCALEHRTDLCPKATCANCGDPDTSADSNCIKRIVLTKKYSAGSKKTLKKVTDLPKTTTIKKIKAKENRKKNNNLN